MADDTNKADSNMILKSEDEPMENGQASTNSHHTEEEEVSDEDFHSLNSQLDALNSALDALENKNDNIQAQLMQLLLSNREARQQFQENHSNSTEDPGQSSSKP